MKPKQTHDYLRYYILNGSEILSILFELQNGQINKSGNSLKYIPQLIQCHLIFKPSFQYRFVISSIIIFSFLEVISGRQFKDFLINIPSLQPKLIYSSEIYCYDKPIRLNQSGIMTMAR